VANVRGLRPSDVRSIEVSLRALIGDLAPDDVPIAYATQVWESFDAIERLAASAKTLLARRVEQTRSWERKGFRSPAEQSASISGTSEAAAKRQLQTSKQLEAVPATADAARAGKLSAQKVEAIASAAMVAPEAEGDLLREAAAPLAHVREECLRARGRGDRELSYARIQHERFSREWIDAEGAWNFMARGTIDAAARFRAVFEPIVEEMFTTARSEGRKEPREAYAFDALIELAERGGHPDPHRQALTSIPRVGAR